MTNLKLILLSAAMLRTLLVLGLATSLTGLSDIAPDSDLRVVGRRGVPVRHLYGQHRDLISKSKRWVEVAEKLAAENVDGYLPRQHSLQKVVSRLWVLLFY